MHTGGDYAAASSPPMMPVVKCKSILKGSHREKCVMEQTPINHTEYSQIVQVIQDAVKVASATPYQPEAKLRELVEPLWEQYFRTNHINLNFQPRNERAFANGRADTVYNRLIIEYKKPNAIKADNAKNRQLISQLKGYIEDLAKEERWKEAAFWG